MTNTAAAAAATPSRSFTVISEEGVYLGTYDAECPLLARDMLAREAGYRDADAMDRTVGRFHGTVEEVGALVVEFSIDDDAFDDSDSDGTAELAETWERWSNATAPGVDWLHFAPVAAERSSNDSSVSDSVRGAVSIVRAAARAAALPGIAIDVRTP